jgi:hypothetical protein
VKGGDLRHVTLPPNTISKRVQHKTVVLYDPSENYIAVSQYQRRSAMFSASQCLRGLDGMKQLN